MSDYNRRTLLINTGKLAAASLSIYGLAACGGDDSSTEGSGSAGAEYSGTLAWGAWPIALACVPGLVARDKGFFKAERLAIKVQPFASGGDAAKYVATGRADFGAGGMATTLALMGSGLKQLRLIGTGFQPVTVNWVVAPDSPIKTVADLRGKKVATLPTGLPDYLLKKMLEGAGMTDKDIKRVNTGGFAEGLNAVQNGLADAGLCAPIISTQAVADGKARVLWDAATEVKELTSDGIWTTQKVIDEKPEVVQQFVNALARGQQFIRKDVAGATASFAKENKLTTKLATSALEPVAPTYEIAINRAGYEANVAANKETGLLKGELPFEEYVNTEFAAAAAKRYAD